MPVSEDSPFGVSDCDNCGAMDVPIAWASEEGFERCVRCQAAEFERLREDMRREVHAAEQRGYAAGYSDGLSDMAAKYDVNAL